MSVRYADYYETLGVPRDADAEKIRKAYRRLARQYHPDVSKSKGAEGRFKEISEAYEVLSDPEKRKRYDTLGANWKHGQEFTPPPGWENIHFEFHGPRHGRGMTFEDLGGGAGFSDFFEYLFGGGRSPSGEEGFGPEAWSGSLRGEDHETEITISLEDAYRGATRSLSLRTEEMDERGHVRQRTRTYEVRIPPGTTEGSRIRLRGQGGGGVGGTRGDLFLRVHVAPHAEFRLIDHDLETDLALAPWEAALGATVHVPTMEGKASLRIPSGTQSGQRIRLRGKGLLLREGHGHGDLYAVVKVVIPKDLSGREKSLFEELAKVSSFKPR